MKCIFIKNFNLILILVLFQFSVFAENLIKNSSFEETHKPDRFGKIFNYWGGWKYEGETAFRLGKIARTGKNSALLQGLDSPKIRLSYKFSDLEPGKYKVTAYIRGLDIGFGKWKQTTEFMFNNKYMKLKKNGTFGWTKLEYVGELKEKQKELSIAFGLMAVGYLWIDDVSLIKVSNETKLTENPILTESEKFPNPKIDITNFKRCKICHYKNFINSSTCYACGTDLKQETVKNNLPKIKKLFSFEEKKLNLNFLKNGITDKFATDGKKSLELKQSYYVIEKKQNWSGYDFLKVDFFTKSKEPFKIYIEVRDTDTKGYWTRVNLNTIVPPGKSTFCLAIDQLYRGEKARPGTKLKASEVTHLIFNIGKDPKDSVFIDNIRLEKDDSLKEVEFKELYAFDLGKDKSPVMPGFTKVTSSLKYNEQKGYGLKDAKIWRSYDVLQPDPLFQDFICIEKGGFAIDLPNGKYHVVVNIDNPSGYWGEYQKYTERVVSSEWREQVKDRMNFDSFKEKYYRFWNVDDTPNDNTFDKYQKKYFDIKEYDIEVKDEQLNINFKGQNWANSVSMIIVFPVSKMEQGKKFLKYVENKRRFYFDNYFKRVLHTPSGDKPKLTESNKKRGFIPFHRDFMKDVYYNDTPFKDEITRTIKGTAFANEIEPLTVSIYPLKDLGKTTVEVTNLTNGDNVIENKDISIGYLSYRLSRVNMDGTVYTIKPRLIIPESSFDIKKGITRRFWLNVTVKTNSPAGIYKGSIIITPENGEAISIAVEFEVLKGNLKEIDIPVGPWGHSISVPWQNDKETKIWNNMLTEKSLKKLREYGFTSFSGMPSLKLLGFRDRKPLIDYDTADFQMERAKKFGFKMPVVNYNHFRGLNLYYQDLSAMKKAGFSDYSEFIKAVFSDIQNHAEVNNWLPVYWNLGDEPIGKDLDRAIKNAESYKTAFPDSPPYFTAATSLRKNDVEDKHFLWIKNLHNANLNIHSEESIKLLHDNNIEWSFYNGSNRWTYGIYMYKAVKEFDMKFRLSWHWNITAGDPYYALDSREDDYAWCNSTPKGDLVSSVSFERLREGIEDYRYFLTLSDHPSKKINEYIQKTLDSFKLGERNIKRSSQIKKDLIQILLSPDSKV